jgi:predicted nucleic acid-binding protein
VVIALDTSVVVRYLAGEPTDQALRARTFIDSSERLGLSSLVLLEVGHVLRTSYGVPRPRVVEVLLDLVTLSNVVTLDLPKDVVVQALARARESENGPYADALIAALARDAGADAIASFDHDTQRYGIPAIEP